MSELQPALDALDDCRDALARLDELCCDPGRSPSMAALGDSLRAARARVDRIALDPDAVDLALDHLEEAGARVGRLQVGCCAPARLPLYARFLEGLTKAQLAVDEVSGRGH